jgi:hypothetical protein
MQVTISLLPASLSLVHIPRSRLPQLSHPILKQILQPNPTFLNVTCNEVELSIFADENMLQDFEPIARRDRSKQRSRSGSGSTSGGRKRSASGADQELVEISYEKWSVLQIDSHSNQIGMSISQNGGHLLDWRNLDSSGERVYELSAPLAAAGISILYQSTYMSDFIFVCQSVIIPLLCFMLYIQVKESRLQEVINLFSEAGFDIYSPEAFSSKAHSESPTRTSFVGDRSSTYGFPTDMIRTEPIAFRCRSILLKKQNE